MKPYKNYRDTIIAQCTPHGSGALCLLRMSGPSSLSICQKMSSLSSKKNIEKVASHTIHHGFIINGPDTIIDEVLFMVMHGPKTFTGQTTVEITCHNNPLIIQSIIEQALNHGAHHAQPGEFTRRAVENNKIDLLQAEAINELIHAHTSTSLKHSLGQLKGSLSHVIISIEQKLRKAHALCEASFEFIDEEMEFDTQILEIIHEVQAILLSLKTSYNAQSHAREGIRIALVGSVNAGKSSLFNALLNKSRSIVTNKAGTTRDTVEAEYINKKNHITLIDTAGLRTTDDIIEQEGIERSFEEAHKADIILVVFDGSRTMTNQEKTLYQKLIKDYPQKTIIIQNKSDLQSAPKNTAIFKDLITLSSTTKENFDILQKTIDLKIDMLINTNQSPFLLTQRHYSVLQELEQQLSIIQNMLETKPEYELLSYHFNDTLSSLTQLTGKSVSEATMDSIFREFCIGK